MPPDARPPWASGPTARYKMFRVKKAMDTRRLVLFLVGCIGTRTALAYAASRASAEWLRVMGVVGLCIGLAFWGLYVFGLRTTGAEVDGGRGGRVWWNGLRPVHGTLYLAFAAMALRGHPSAWVPLAIDVGVGLAAFASHL